ncbi:MAG: DUF465 domain-containing protein [Bdellovibrionales bacterium]|jgi:hypothetical protein
MTLSHRIESLRKRHTDIEEQLHIEESRASGDEAKISQLKRDKLNLKDEITRLESQKVDAA